MINVEDSNSVYYYHFDGLGSVVALSDAAGDTVQTYEYSIYGQVAASDPNHPNPYLFTGRRFDTETGLYYYRARYYNPYIGRFMQADSVGYTAGMNLYTYCGNNPLGYTDPSGFVGIMVTIMAEAVTDNPTEINAYQDVLAYLLRISQCFWINEWGNDWHLTRVQLLHGEFGDYYEVVIDVVPDSCDVDAALDILEKMQNDIAAANRSYFFNPRLRELRRRLFWLKLELADAISGFTMAAGTDWILEQAQQLQGELFFPATGYTPEIYLNCDLIAAVAGTVRETVHSPLSRKAYHEAQRVTSIKAQISQLQAEIEALENYSNGISFPTPVLSNQ